MLPSTRLPDVEPERVRRLRRSEYEQLVSAGAFDRERLELVRGVIVTMSPQDAAHSGPIVVLTQLLVVALADRATVRIQLPLIAGDDSVPEPDVAVVPLGSPHRAHPSTAHVVIEVANSSQTYDRRTKGPLYAEMGVPDYWVIDVVARTIEVHREPRGDHYARVETFTTGTIALAAFPDVAIDVELVLG